jgi:hypothetical protein
LPLWGQQQEHNHQLTTRILANNFEHTLVTKITSCCSILQGNHREGETKTSFFLR